MTILIFILSTFSFGLLGTYYVKRNNVIKKRIDKFVPKETRSVQIKKNKVEKEKKNTSFFKNIIETLAKAITPKKNEKKKLSSDLETAGLTVKAEEFLIIKLLLAIIVTIIFIILKSHLAVSLLFGVVSFFIPNVYLRTKREKRLANCATQLPQTLETMATAMKSGYSFMQAMKLVGEEVADPIGPEFLRTIQEINLGVSMEKAFDNLMLRLPNKDLEIVVTAVLIQRSTGGNLSQILETIQDTINDRIQIKDELKALTAQGKMSAIIISSLPFVLALFLNVMSPDYFSPLLHHPLGWVFLGAGLISGTIGWLLIQKIVRIEV